MTHRLILSAVALAAIALAPGAASAQDAAAGEKVFKRCAACHAVGPSAANKAGPELNGLVGRKIAGVADYSSYSDALKAFGEGKTWDEATLDKWFESPKTLVDGTSMAFAGLKKEDDRKNLIAYLAGFDESGASK
ncbi:c-type cytochrome [Chenggangzhangella methanolivorans]|uniref:Cytochrome c family protein n=1 Tax=Chenggangzhangella methanolivorans TaxID=1437009 RepID=A0A9E6UMN4_9HYPH|nr:cytochrome c family protein [Chenggangzhangella methanolivorans]QZO00181.1 cytochrome c family protein [Chenggangzhangella methanolivorans]